MSSVWMVRHAPVDVSGVCYGQFDVATTMDATTAADAILRALSGSDVPSWDEIWSSPWQRTEPVAALLARRFGVPVRRDPRLSELDFGEWEGLPFSEIESRDGERFQAWMASYDTVAPPGGETADELLRRVAGFLDDVEKAGSRVLAVCHAGTIRAARAVRANARFSSVAHAPVKFLVPESI